jgi:hypothetical protein
MLFKIPDNPSFLDQPMHGLWGLRHFNRPAFQHTTIKAQIPSQQIKVITPARTSFAVRSLTVPLLPPLPLPLLSVGSIHPLLGISSSGPCREDHNHPESHGQDPTRHDEEPEIAVAKGPGL